MAYGIRSESDIINIEAIKAGCNLIDKAAEDYKTCGDKVIYASEVCNSEALSVDQMSLSPSIKEVGENIKLIEGYIEEFTKEIRQYASRVYNEQWAELRAYRQELARQQELAKQNESNT